MIIIYSSSLIFNSILWIFAPALFFPGYIWIIFLINGVCTAGINSALSHYFLIITLDEERVNANMFYSMTSGAIAGIAGIFLGGGLLKLIHILGFSGLPIYRRYFAIVFGINLVLFLIISRLDRLEDWKIRDVLGIFVSFRDIRALFTLNKLTSSYSFQQDYSGVIRLREFPSHLSEKQLLAYLKSPRFIIRSKALSALRQIQFGKATVQELIREVERGKFTTAYIAAEILGEHHVKEAIPVLRESLHSDDLYLQGKALVALAQLMDEKSFPEIIRIFEESTNPRIVLHGGRALVETGNNNYSRNLIAKLFRNKFPFQIRDELLFDIAELADCDDEVYRFLKSYRENPAESKMVLIDIFKEYTQKSRKNLINFIEAIDKIEWREFCQCKPLIQFLKVMLEKVNTTISKNIFELLNEFEKNDTATEIVFALMIIAAHEIVFNSEN
jgi:F0F1-type ATP synthase delta subunit